jgi:hypothetical protein
MGGKSSSGKLRSSNARSIAWIILTAYALFVLTHLLRYGTVPASEEDLTNVRGRLDSLGTIEVGLSRVKSSHVVLYLEGLTQQFVVALPGVSATKFETAIGDTVVIAVRNRNWSSSSNGSEVFVYGVRTESSVLISPKVSIAELHDRFPLHPLMVVAVVGAILVLIFTRTRRAESVSSIESTDL